MAGELRIGGTDASVKLQGNDTIKSDQTYTFPDSGAEIVVTPGTAEIETSGDITAGGQIYAGGNAFNGQNTGSRLSAGGAIYASAESGTLWGGYKTGSNAFTSQIDADGILKLKTRIFVDNPDVNSATAQGCYLSSSGLVRAQRSGDRPQSDDSFQAYWGKSKVWSVDGNGSTRAANFIIDLDRDNSANFVSTTNAEGETEQVYSGPTLNVREVLLNLQSKVEALQAEIQTLKGGAS